MSIKATGKVVKAFGNLLHVEFQGNIRQGEVALVHVGGVALKGEVIEIVGNVAKIQVFEDTRGVKLDTAGGIFHPFARSRAWTWSADIDCRWSAKSPRKSRRCNRLVSLARRLHSTLDRTRHWDYHPDRQSRRSVVQRGDSLGYTMEGRFHHQIMVPFTIYGNYTITWVIKPGSYTIDTVVAKAVDETGRRASISPWCKNGLSRMPLFRREKNQSRTA